MDELAEQIASWENEIPIDDLTRKQRKRVYVSLYQTHLPKLSETNLVEYDIDDGDIRLGDRATDMDRFLTSKETPAYPWRKYYVGFLALGGMLMAIGVVATSWIGPTSLLGLAVLLVVGYLAMIAVEYWHVRKRQSEIPNELVPTDQ